jgi:hypothetical protein
VSCLRIHGARTRSGKNDAQYVGFERARTIEHGRLDRESRILSVSTEHENVAIGIATPAFSPRAYSHENVQRLVRIRPCTKV